MEKNSKIYVAGGSGMVGSAIIRKLKSEGYSNIITRRSSELDLRNQQQTLDFFEKEKPEYVFLAAAKVGGIMANNIYRADFIYENLMIQSNIIHASYLNKVDKLLFLGSSCIYPKMAPQPLKEEYLLTSSLEETNEPYAIAKIAGIKMCQSYRDQYDCNFISVMPTNLYGPNDNYNLKNSHVFPALLRKIHEAKISNLDSVEIWGSGSPKREFLHVDDLADACLFLMNDYNDRIPLNIGYGDDITIKELANMISSEIGFTGSFKFDPSSPDGVPRKLMDTTRINNLGWFPKITLKDGIHMAYKSMLNENGRI